MVSKTEYVSIQGKIYWAKIYQPDEFRGAVRWTAEFEPSNDAEWAKIKELGIQKKVKENKGGIEGKHINIMRPTTKLIKGQIIHFAPPTIYDKDGKHLVKYVNSDGKETRSSDKKDFYTREGDGPLIGNGSEVSVTLCVYPTGMGTGFRLESIRLIDLVEYVRPDPDETDHEEAVETGKAPW